MRAGLARVAVPQQQRPLSRTHTWPAPSRGWLSDENLSSVKPGGAFIMENWVPTLTGARVRKGRQKFADIGSNAVQSLFSYRSGSSHKIFAADVNDIWDITSVADPDTPEASVVTGQTSGYYSTLQFEVAGGDYLYCFNGDDSPQLYDGASTWLAVTGVSSPAITGVTTSDLIQGWVYRNRIYMVEKNSMSAWYLPVDSLGGAATEISMRGVFQKGGNLLLGTTWSLDAGDGADDKCVFISDQGEVAIYEGSYPGDSTWKLVGVYEITKPLGKNATMKAGGDRLVMTNDGIVPISMAINKDAAALSLAAVTRPIEPEWKIEARAREGNGPWEILKWPNNNIAVVALPGAATETVRYCFIVNLETGRWAKWTNYDAQCMTLHEEWGYFGDMSGNIFRMETTGADAGSSYECVYVGHFDHLKKPGYDKTVHMMRATFRYSIPFTAKVSVSTNYIKSLPAAPAAAASNSSDVWDTGIWDTAVWDGSGVFVLDNKWVSIGRTGFVVAPQVQITCGDPVAPDVELISMDALYEYGGVVV